MTAAVRKRDVFVGGAAFFAYFLSPPKESRFINTKLISTPKSSRHRRLIEYKSSARQLTACDEEINNLEQRRRLQNIAPQFKNRGDRHSKQN